VTLALLFLSVDELSTIIEFFGDLGFRSCRMQLVPVVVTHFEDSGVNSIFVSFRNDGDAFNMKTRSMFLSVWWLPHIRFEVPIQDNYLFVMTVLSMLNHFVEMALIGLKSLLLFVVFDAFGN
jgi:hypothetical protein